MHANGNWMNDDQRSAVRDDAAVRELQEAGAVKEKREDRFGDTKAGWWLDGVFLGETARQAIEAKNG